MIKGLGRSSSAHSKGFTRSGHSSNVINDIHLSKRDRGKYASEGHKNLTGTQPWFRLQDFEFGLSNKGQNMQY